MRSVEKSRLATHLPISPSSCLPVFLVGEVFWYTAAMSQAVVTESHTARRNRGVFFLGLACACVGFAIMLQMAVNSNFVGEEQYLNLAPQQQGYLESIRETCGISAFAILAILAGLAEPLVAAGVLVLFAAGIAGYAFVPDFTWVVLMSLVWSQGLHIWMPLPNSMALALAEPGRAGHRLGQMQAAGAIGSALGLLLALLLTWQGISIRSLYIVAGAAAMVGAAACLGIPRNVKTPGPRLIFRRRYGLYYFLCFLEGWRKQIFLCFAGFLLVKNYGIELKTMLVLWIIAQAIGYFAAPRIGRLIDRVGERPVLVFYYSSMIAIFAGYLAVPGDFVLFNLSCAWLSPVVASACDVTLPAQLPIGGLHILCALFVADSVFFAFNAALTTYVNKIAPPAEHTATLSMGVAMNHVAAVTMPLVGGLLWKYLGYQYAFLMGAVAAVASVIVSTFVPAQATQALPAVAEE